MRWFIWSMNTRHSGKRWSSKVIFDIISLPFSLPRALYRRGTFFFSARLFIHYYTQSMIQDWDIFDPQQSYISRSIILHSRIVHIDLTLCRVLYRLRFIINRYRRARGRSIAHNRVHFHTTNNFSTENRIFNGKPCGSSIEQTIHNILLKYWGKHEFSGYKRN